MSLFNMTFSPLESFPQFCDAATDMTIQLGTTELTPKMKTSIVDIGWAFALFDSRRVRNIHKITKSCMGALHCTNPQCILVNSEKPVDQRPCTTDKAIAKQKCNMCHQGGLTRIHCPVKVQFHFENDTCHMLPGNDDLTTAHTHGSYHAIHVTPSSMKTFVETIKNQPGNLTTKAMMVGTSSLSSGPMPLGNVDDIFMNKDRTRQLKYKVEKVLNLKTAITTTIEEMMDLQQHYPDHFRLCNIKLNQFMISIVSDSIVGPLLDFTSNPVLTDVTFSVFHGYYLCSSVIYCKELGRHVLLYAAAIRNNDAGTFKTYFIDFFDAFGIQFEDDVYLGMVMDFSQAQVKGYLEAIASTTGKHDKYGLKFLKGCRFHFSSSVTKLTSAFATVLPLPSDLETANTTEKKTAINDQLQQLEKLIYGLQEVTTETEFDSTIDTINNNFPNTENWINFWNRQNIRSMIFPAVTEMNDKLLEHPTRTTNGIEAYHRDLYRVLKRDEGLLTNFKVKIKL
jgi:hypothetical protein